MSISEQTRQNVVGCPWIVAIAGLVAGLIGSFFDAVRPAGLIIAAAAVTLFAVLAVGSAGSGSAFAGVKAVTVAASLDLLAAGGLASPGSGAPFSAWWPSPPVSSP